MKIFEVSADVTKYQSIFTVDDSARTLLKTIFDSSSRLKEWEEIEFFVFDTRLMVPDFYYIGNSSAFACNEKAVEEFGRLFNIGCELLPIRLETGEKLYIVNVLDCINCLNEKLSVFDYYDNGDRGRILKYSFHKRFTESSLFKIPQNPKAAIFAYSRFKSAYDEFYTTYQNSNFKGLIFEEVFSDE